jgi:surface antigen
MAATTLAATLLLGGCAATRDAVDWVGDTIGGSTAGSQQAVALPAPSYLSETPARIVTPRKRLQCVPYARQISEVSIRGNASTWWSSAKGRYGRGGKPKVGSVLVLKRAGRLRYGHIAVVTRILGSREIVVDHANWLNRGRLHLGTPVQDVSANNDWSAVRVWYTPGKKYGIHSYPAHGFIYPEAPVAAISVQQGFLPVLAARPTGRPSVGLDLGNS